MTNAQRVMILGAGVYQLPLIRRARALGLEVHVVSRPGSYPGIHAADVFHPIDTTDEPGVLNLARELRIEAILTAGTDVCVPAMGAVNDALGLRGVSRAAADALSLKGVFRAFQAANGIPGPRFSVVRDPEACLAWVAEAAAPVIVKPVDSSGSRGVSRLEDADPERVRAAFASALACSRRGEVCVETVIAGVEVGGNALLYEGRTVFMGVTAKHMSGFIVRGHEYPTGISARQQECVRDALAACCRALGYRDGALNFDVMVDGEHATIIELGARLGGNGLTDLTERAFGYDVQTELIRMAMGQAPASPPGGRVNACGSYVFGSDRSGRLAGLQPADEVRRDCSWLRDLVLQAKVGDAVCGMRSNADLVGYATFDIPPGLRWSECCERLSQALAMEVSS